MTPVDIWAALGIVGVVSGTLLLITSIRRLVIIYSHNENGNYRLAAWIQLIWPLTLFPIYFGISFLTIQAWDDKYDIEWTLPRLLVIGFEAFIVFWTLVLALTTTILRRR